MDLKCPACKKPFDDSGKFYHVEKLCKDCRESLDCELDDINCLGPNRYQCIECKKILCIRYIFCYLCTTCRKTRSGCQCNGKSVWVVWCKECNKKQAEDYTEELLWKMTAVKSGQ